MYVPGNPHPPRTTCHGPCRGCWTPLKTRRAVCPSPDARWSWACWTATWWTCPRTCCARWWSWTYASRCWIRSGTGVLARSGGRTPTTSLHLRIYEYLYWVCPSAVVSCTTWWHRCRPGWVLFWIVHPHTALVPWWDCRLLHWLDCPCNGNRTARVRFSPAAAWSVPQTRFWKSWSHARGGVCRSCKVMGMSSFILVGCPDLIHLLCLNARILVILILILLNDLVLRKILL